jgi:hypothetical protein
MHDWKPNSLYSITLIIETLIAFVRFVILFPFIFIAWSLLPFSIVVVQLAFQFFSSDLSVPSSLSGVFAGKELLVLNALFWLTLLSDILISFGPIFFSVLAYLGYGSGRSLTRYMVGARDPSTRERQQINQVLRQVVGHASGHLKGFEGIFVVDSVMEIAYLIGTTLYISSQAIRGQHLLPLLAHELGHNQRDDGGVILALRRLVNPIMFFLGGNVRDFSTGKALKKELTPVNKFFGVVNHLASLLFSLIGGGFGVWLTSFRWASYFRQRDYLADNFAARHGVKDSLLAYLEENKFFDISVPHMMGWRPVNEQRIDMLLHPRPLTERTGANLLDDIGVLWREVTWSLFGRA